MRNYIKTVCIIKCSVRGFGYAETESQKTRHCMVSTAVFYYKKVLDNIQASGYNIQGVKIIYFTPDISGE